MDELFLGNTASRNLNINFLYNSNMKVNSVINVQKNNTEDIESNVEPFITEPEESTFEVAFVI
jgi:hypothetical protein